jgi:nitrate reductase (NAD(P)H)
MMNNWWFRVAVHQQDDGRSVRFEHPTLAGVHAGGWMERLKDEGQDILKPVFGKKVDAPGPSTMKPIVKKEVSMVKESIKRIITAEELKAHTDPDHPWFVVRGEGTSNKVKIASTGDEADNFDAIVYDGSGFMKDHPGGGESISLVAGQDAVSLNRSITLILMLRLERCRPRTSCRSIRHRGGRCWQSKASWSSPTCYL